MKRATLDLPVGPQAARIFFGLRAPFLAPQPGDSEAVRAEKRAKFFGELGGTFMPGTPLMQAPLGLSAYVPAVIDPPEGSDLPDEAAIIVYASREVYDRFRSTSLSRRMYTRSHWAVFDMDRSPAVFPSAATDPAKGTYRGAEAWFGYMSDAATDWQAGYTRFLLVSTETPSDAFREAAFAAVVSAAARAPAIGIDQVLIGAAPGFAAMWVHSDAEVADAAGQLGLVPEGGTLLRDLPAEPKPVIGDAETGVTVAGASAFTFRFARYLEFFDDRAR